MWKAPSLSPTPATVLPLFSPRLIDRLRFLFLETLFKTGQSSQLCLRGFKLNYPNIIPFEITTSGFRGKREFQRRRVIVEKRKEETWPSWPLEIIMNGERPSLASRELGRVSILPFISSRVKDGERKRSISIHCPASRRKHLNCIPTPTCIAFRKENTREEEEEPIDIVNGIRLNRERKKRVRDGPLTVLRREGKKRNCKFDNAPFERRAE